jgi:predicted alpha-1,2-mannosidase
MKINSFVKRLFFVGCVFQYVSIVSAQINYINPLIGSEKMGHTFPGATVPFGAVQLSPDTDTIPFLINGNYNNEIYKYCAGYKYEDKSIVGFSHTHFSGTGHSDLGDILIMPTQGALQINPGVSTDTKSGFRSAFSHKNEHAEAGYYRVLLEDDSILAELTTTTRVGMHQYTFYKEKKTHIILDLMAGIYNYEDKNVQTFINVVNDTLILGYKQTTGWARTKTVYFALSFSKPFQSYGQKNYDKKTGYNGFWGKFNQADNFPLISGKNIRLHVDFDVKSNEKISVKCALSSVSQENALENMLNEIPTWNFEKVKFQAQKSWENEMNNFKIEASDTIKTNFYTALYHSFIAPTVYEDVTKQYKGIDQQTHRSTSFTNYTTFSLWDTYRALHPMFTLFQPKRANDMVHAMLAHYEQNPLKMLPIWSHYANDNWCMSGYHSVSVIADAIVKGVYKGDAEFALKACIETANKRNYEGIGEYITNGYIPAEKSGISVSNTLEYAYDDWCIAQIAQKLNKLDVYQTFMKRSNHWQNNFNPSTGFMQPKRIDGSFSTSFDPLSTHGQGFIEGNSWNYSFFVPHNPTKLIECMGGDKRFINRLDSLFTMNLPDQFFAETEDITREGIIGGYVHGNEPAHHVAYLYNWTSKPWKTQAQIRDILIKQYQPMPDGLGGNDDCGQMSAWYVLSALGFYPVAPGSTDYSIGSPIVNSALIKLENQREIRIIAHNQNLKNCYIQKIKLNGKIYNRLNIKHEDILKGIDIEFFMGSKPNKKLIKATF